MSIGGMLTQKCDIYRKNDLGEDQYALTSTSYTKLYSNVKCHIQQISRLSSLYALNIAGIDQNIKFVGYFFSNQNIKEGDRVEWEGYTLFVVSSPPTFDRQKKHHKEVYFITQDD